MAKLLDIVKPGVVTGEDVQKYLSMPKAKQLRDPCSKTAWALTP